MENTMEPGDTGPEGGAMVSVRNAYLSYGPAKEVLRGFHLTAQRGSIYAFLGPSGCGKTTLLKCLIGRSQLDSGQILLGISYKHQLGYMPQDSALVGDFSINEMICFFGKLLGMDSHKLIERKKELYNFLDLPHESRIIGSLSGGQQRRVSLCIALLHDPQLLILDEPTVGLDPLLSHSIWNHFKELTRNGQKTIIVTTHYIEDAKNAHQVGMMREGVLLVEGSPTALMAEHGTDRLEEIFLKLSQFQELQPQKESPKPCSLFKKQKNLLAGKISFSLTRVCAHLMKNLFWLLRNKGILGFLLILPIVQSTFFGLAIGREPHGLNFGVVNDELASGWAANSTGDSSFNCTSPSLASLRYLQQLAKTNLKFVNFLDKESAEEATRRGDVWGYLHISANYTDSLFERLQLGLFTAAEEVNFSGDVSVVVEMFNTYIKTFIMRDVYLSYQDFLKELYEYCKWPVKAALTPITVEPPVYGSMSPKFTDFAVPAMLIVCMFTFPAVYTAASLLAEKRDKLMERSLISGMTMVEYLLGNGIMSLALLIVQTFLMITVAYGLFDYALVGNVFLVYLISIFTGLCGMFFGFLVALSCEKDVTATSLLIGVMTTLSLISGLVWPLEGMHYLLRLAGRILPLAATTEAIRSVTSRGLGFTHPTVYPAFVTLSLWMVIFSAVTYFSHQMKNISRHLVLRRSQG